MSTAPTPTEAPAHTRGRKAFVVLGLLLLVVVSAIGLYAWLNAGRETTDDAIVEADVVAVTARVGGVVASLVTRDNQIVRKGDVIVRLDDADFVAKLAQARADLQTARAQAAGAHAQATVAAATARGGLQGAQAQLTTSASGVQTAEAQIAAAQAALAKAEAEVEKTTKDLARAKELVAADAIARQQLDAAQLAFDSAQAARRQATANVTAAQETRRMAESRVAEARARVSQTTPVSQQIEAAQAAAALAEARVVAAEAAVKLAELQLSYTTVVAPADGLVTQLGAREGGQVAAGQPLAQLVPLASYVIANFKETQIDRMKVGDLAEVRIDAYPGRSFPAVVESLAGGTGSRFSLLPPDNASGNFVKVVQRVPVRLSWKTVPDVTLKAGLSAEATVTVAASRQH